MITSLTYDHVLLVDDDSIINLVHEHLFKKIGISKRLKAFINPINALTELQKLLMDPNVKILVLLDLNMAEMSGFEFLEMVSKFNNNTLIFDLIIVSSSIDKNDISKGNRHPLVHGFLTKPLTFDKISEFLENQSRIAKQS